MNVLALTLLLSCLPSALIDFALPKWKADKNVRIEDAYKWTFQATRGGEHAVPDTESARNWMMGEWDSLSAKAAVEPIWDPLCKGDDIGRLNLRPFKARGGKPDDLLDAFLASSREYRSDRKNFVTAWNELGRRLKKRPAGNLKYGDWLSLDTEMKARNYPAVHHSKAYDEAVQPSYRILTKAEMNKLLAPIK
ncbi:MAG TPA: hypothetical protein PLP21_06925 [Pyrinomonadaceae bacterium]|nr:hypothetical protein [Pyrinomonadaceae bacterium]